MPIYLTEFGVQSQPNRNSACPSPSRPNSTRSPNTSPGPTRAWRPSRSTCCATTRRRRARSERARRLRRLPDRPRVRQRQAQAAVLRLAAAARRSPSSGHGFSLWGLVRPTTGPTNVTVLVQLQGLQALPHAQERSHQLARLLELQLLRARRRLARALDEPERADATKARRSLRTDSAPSTSPYDGAMPELPEVEITARRARRRAARRRDRVGARAGHQRAEDLRPAARRRCRADASPACAGAAST